MVEVKTMVLTIVMEMVVIIRNLKVVNSYFNFDLDQTFVVVVRFNFAVRMG